MQRDMNLVIRIMEGLSTSEGTWGSGFTILSTEQSRNVTKEEPDAVLLPVSLCPNVQTLRYHVDIMEQGLLIEKSRYLQGGYPVCRLTWEGNDFLDSIRQEGVLERVQAEHGDSWQDWAIDVTKTVFAEVAKQIAMKPFL